MSQLRNQVVVLGYALLMEASCSQFVSGLDAVGRSAAVAAPSVKLSDMSVLVMMLRQELQHHIPKQQTRVKNGCTLHLEI